MTATNQSDRAMFQDTWQTWLILRHFLPARLQRQLVHEIIHSASGGAIKFEDLFEEIAIDQPIWNEAWMVRPRSSQKEYAAALQEWVRSIVWQNDQNMLGNREDEKDPSRLSLGFLSMVTSLSIRDFGWKDDGFEKYFERYQSSIQPILRRYLDTLYVAQQNCPERNAVEFWDEIVEQAQVAPMPLQAVMLKHYADLCADIDAWNHALEGYQRVEPMLSNWTPPPEWEDSANAWKTIVLQSRAGALHTLHGTTTKPGILEAALAAKSLDENPLFATNTGLDVLASHSDKLGYVDPRISLQWAPLTHRAHEANNAMAQWVLGKHQDAHRWFWAILRRQIALGAATEMRATKAWYARCLFEDIAANLASQDRRKTFVMAGRLLLESQYDKHVTQIKWTSALVDAYVNEEDIIAPLMQHACAHEGTKLGRMLVLVELFKAWALEASRRDIVVILWKRIAQVARDFKAAFSHHEDVGRPALKALQELGKKRPAGIPKVGAEVAEAICQKIREDFHWGQSEAIDAALPYTEDLGIESLKGVTTAILELLEREDPAKDFWPLNRPALRFLVDHFVRERLRDEDELNRRALAQIFRHGLASENQPMMIFFHLADFDGKLLEEETTRAKLAEPLERVRQGAHKINSSNVTDNIRALLVAPRIAGFEGIQDALEGLGKIITSAKSGSGVSVGFTDIDDPLLLLVEYKARIRVALIDHREWFDAKLEELAKRLAEMWEFAPTNPLIFAPFAIPEATKPNRVVIHNCAFASIRFAHAVGHDERMRRALDTACENDLLRSEITLARATHSSGEKYSAGEQQTILPNEEPTTFYAAIGRRLTYLQRLPHDAAREFAKQLVENCIRLGPHAADAAVLIAAANLGLHEFVRACELRPYEATVRQDSATRMLLLPILDLFSQANPDEG